MYDPYNKTVHMEEKMTIAASEARQRFFEMLEKVQKSPEGIVIERKGRPVALLLDYQSQKGRSTSTGDPNLFARIRRFHKKIRRSRGHSPRIDSVAIVRAIRDES